MTEEPLCFISSFQFSLLSYSMTSLGSMLSHKALSHSLTHRIGITADLQREEVSLGCRTPATPAAPHLHRSLVSDGGLTWCALLGSQNFTWLALLGSPVLSLAPVTPVAPHLHHSPI